MHTLFSRFRKSPELKVFAPWTATLAAWLTLILPSGSFAAEELVIAGAGPSTKVVKAFVKLLAEEDAAQGYSFEVPSKSAKHAGGMKNTETFLFGRTGRPLNEKEKAGGVEEIFLAKMPIIFVVGGQTGVRSLTLEQVCGVFTGKHRNWKEVGGKDGQIVIITREPTEALFLELKRDVPCMNDITDTPYVLKKDDHVIDMIKNTDLGRSAIGFGAARNFPGAVHLEVSGFESGVKLGLVHKASRGDDPLVKAARKVAQSEEWKVLLGKMELGLP